MIAFPETQKRAQEEIDEVVGRERLPSFDDYEKLSFVRAMVIPPFNKYLLLSPLFRQKRRYAGAQSPLLEYRIVLPRYIIPNICLVLP